MYSKLLELWKRERKNPELLPLRDSFLQELRVHIEQILTATQAENGNEIQRQISKSELTNLRFMLTSLLQRRIEKMLKMLLASTPIDYDLLSRQERRFIEQVSRNMRTALLVEEDLFAPLDAESSSGFLLIRFLEECPELVGADMKTYGPFRADDLATLPLENARMLIRRNTAEAVNFKRANP
ncbi:MAG: hypothetical protein ACFFDP_02810 [Promethearchaeota archaeon]